MLELLAVAFVFGGLVCLVLALTWKQDSAGLLAARLSGLRGDSSVYGYGNGTEESLSSRVLLPLVDGLGARLSNLLPAKWAQAIEKQLIQAGRPTSLPGFLIAALLSALGLAGLAFVLSLSMGLSGSNGLLIMIAGFTIGFYVPRIWLRNRVATRQKEILKSLPDAFDLITVCVEAGLGLEAALAKVAEKAEGPFGEELAICLREISLGKLRREALKEMADRTGVQDLTTFINAVVQAESMGTSIATVLRVQAEQMRINRRQRAEKAAHEAPIKMMFPLVLCIFPTLMMVILGPAGIKLFEQFSSR